MKERVEQWLRASTPGLAEVVSIDGNGSDWAGSTEGGFYSVFSAQVTYVDHDGKRWTVSVEGEEMADLWRFLMADA